MEKEKKEFRLIKLFIGIDIDFFQNHSKLNQFKRKIKFLKISCINVQDSLHDENQTSKE